VPGLKDRLASAGYRLGWSLVCRLPESWMRALFELVADIAWRRQGLRVQVLEANLRRVLGPGTTGAQLRAASRATMRSYARYWLEVFRLPVMPPRRITEHTVVTGDLPVALESLARGRGVIFALPHMGNYDEAGAWIIGHGAGSLTTVAERLKPDSVFGKFIAFREGLGMEVLPASGPVNRFGILAQRLRAGRLVCLVTDRDVTGAGIEVEFFGERARMMGGSAALAVQTGAALMPVTLWFTEDGWHLHVHPEVEVPAEGERKDKVAAMTQALARVFEQGIREHPEDWHMLQPVFTADLDPARVQAADAASADAQRLEAASL
jgi:lauroyl/myristoyl acyltransferase